MGNITTLLKGNELFQKSYFQKHEAEFLDLVEHGQHPKALFIGCADSRVVPSLITNTPPGGLFVLRNVGNFVEPYESNEDYHATASGIEYAVSVLKVSEIIICGHTHCGAIAALFEDIDNQLFVHTKKWLSLAEKAKEVAQFLLIDKNSDKETLCKLTEKISVIFQIENLLTYPSVKEKVDNGSLYIHGWIYDIETGEIEYYDPDTYDFLSLKESQSQA